ncbi:MAG: hypothetical protein ABH859_00045 [Pseudomonadota bacterium]
MKIRLFALALTLMMLAACSAFDSGENDLGDGSSVVMPSVVAGLDSQFAGDYIGAMILQENTCSNLAAEIGEKTPVKINVIQSGTLVSLGFADETEASGILNEANEATIVKRQFAKVDVYDVTFADDGNIKGTVEHMEHGMGDSNMDPCAVYDLNLVKE